MFYDYGAFLLVETNLVKKKQSRYLLRIIQKDVSFSHIRHILHMSKAVQEVLLDATSLREECEP